GPRTKTSTAPFVSPPTRFEANEPKATKRPSAEIDGPPLMSFPSMPAELTLTRVVVPVSRSRTKTSETPFVSPPTRFEASETKATKRPAAEIDGSLLSLFPSTPAELTLTLVMVPVSRSRTKTSPVPFVSPPTRFEASDQNATKRPSAEIDGLELRSF